MAKAALRDRRHRARVVGALSIAAGVVGLVAFIFVASGRAGDEAFLFASASPVVGLPFALIAALGGARSLAVIGVAANVAVAAVFWSVELG